MKFVGAKALFKIKNEFNKQTPSIVIIVTATDVKKTFLMFF